MTKDIQAPRYALALHTEGPMYYVLPGFSRQFTSHENMYVAICEEALQNGDSLLLMTEKLIPKDRPLIACRVRVQSVQRLKKGAKIMLKGLERVRVLHRKSKDDLLYCWEPVPQPVPDQRQTQAIARGIMRALGGRDGKHGGLPKAFGSQFPDMERDPDSVDHLAMMMVESASPAFARDMLCTLDIEQRAIILITHLAQFRDEMLLDQRIRRRVKKQVEKSHEEYRLAEEAKAIQEELKGSGASQAEQLLKQVKEAGMPQAAADKCEEEIRRLRAVSQASPEHAVITEYLKRMIELPWSRRSEEAIDLRAAERALDEDHHGLAKPKERILEHLAVQRRLGKPGGTILCFEGPPGVGKTSLGKSVARATQRSFARISLGGIHEEAAIRGHRRTYVASMPGRIINALIKAKVRNPVLMLDEIDKLVLMRGYHGDPAAALLEVLDPEQNRSFVDQYIDTEFDLSEVLFIVTANDTDALPDPLRDRLEIVKLSGYVDDEKIDIARRHLIPKQLRRHGLADDGVKLPTTALREIIKDYTYEAGVRGLERCVAKICRKLATAKAEAGGKLPAARRAVGKQQLPDLLSRPEYYPYFSVPARARIGYCCGLEPGAGVVPIEALLHNREGEEKTEVLGLTRHGEDEVKSLVAVAQTLLRANAGRLGLPDGFDFKQRQVCINMQYGVGSYCGPLGGALFALLFSACTRTPLRPGVAIAGEINLRGELRGGMLRSYQDLALSAQRHRLKTIVLPRDDAHLLQKVPATLRRQLRFVPVSDVGEVLAEVAVRQPPAARSWTAPGSAAAARGRAAH